MNLPACTPGQTWILVIDDDPGTREALADILERAGYGVVSLEDGDLSAAPRRQDFKVAVVDYHLPEASGLEVARRLKARQPQCRVVLISSEQPPEADPAVDRFLAKPFSKEAILGVIAELCPPSET